MRTRSKGALLGPFVTLSIRSNNTGTVRNCDQMASASASTGTYSTMEDLNNFTALLNGVSNNPCRRVKITRSGDPAETHTESVMNNNGSYGSVTVSGPFAGSLLSSISSPDVDLSTQASVNLISAFADMNKSDMLGGESIATMKQTASMIKRPLAGLQDVILKLFKKHNVKKSRFRKQLRARNRKILRDKSISEPLRKHRLEQSLSIFNSAVSNSYLEMRYGMFPLMWDVEGLIDLFVKEYFTVENSLTPVIRVARGKTARGSNSSGGVFQPEFPYLEGIFQTSASFSSEMTKRISAGVIYEIKPSCTLDRAVSHVGLRLRDIPSTMWELLPFSFVIDWAVNVGDWLQAIVPVPNIRPVSSWSTTNTVTTKRINSVSFDMEFGWGKPERRHFTFGGATEEVDIYERVVNPGLSTHPMITGKPLSNLRIADSAALAAQQVAGLLKRLHH